MMQLIVEIIIFWLIVVSHLGGLGILGYYELQAWRKKDRIIM